MKSKQTSVHVTVSVKVSEFVFVTGLETAGAEELDETRTIVFVLVFVFVTTLVLVLREEDSVQVVLLLLAGVGATVELLWVMVHGQSVMV